MTAALTRVRRNAYTHRQLCKMRRDVQTEKIQREIKMYACVCYLERNSCYSATWSMWWCARIRAITRMAGGCDPDESSQWTVPLETTRQYPALRVASIVRYTSRPTYPELVVDESTGHPDRHREDNYEEALHIVAFCLTIFQRKPTFVRRNIRKWNYRMVVSWQQISR